MYFICFTCMFCAEDVISPRRKLGMYWPLDPTPGDWVGEPKLIGSGEFMIIFFSVFENSNSENDQSWEKNVAETLN